MVTYKYENHTDQRLEQTDGGRVTEVRDLAGVKGLVVDIGLKNLTGIDNVVVLHNEYGFEEVHDLGQVQNDDRKNGISQSREGNVSHLLETTRTVDGSGFIQLRIDTCKCCHEDNGLPTCLFPEVYQEVDRSPPFFTGQEVDLMSLLEHTDIDQEGVYETVAVGSQDQGKQGRGNYPRQEVGQIDNGLHRFFEMDINDLI